MDRTFRLSVLMAAFAASALAVVAGIWLSQVSTIFALLPILLFAMLIFGYGTIAALDGARWAIAIFVPVAVVITSGTLRPGDAPEGTDLQSIVKFGIYCMAFLIGVLAFRYTYPAFRSRTGIILLLYVCWAVITTTFSPIPAYTMAASFGALAWALLGAALCFRFEPRQVLLVLMTAMSCYVYLSWFVYLFVAGLGTMHFGDPEGGMDRFSGLSGTANSAGHLMTVYLIVMISFLLSGFRFESRYRFWPILYFGASAMLALTALIMTDSRGAMLGLTAVLLSIVVQKTRSLPYAILAGLLLLFVIFAVPNPVDLFRSFLNLVSRSTNDFSNLFTLTGRIYVWDAVLDKIAQSPLIGNGYASSREVVEGAYTNRWGVSFSSAHNFILQSMIDVGLVGTTMLILLFITCAMRYVRQPNAFRDSVFVLVFVTGLVESGVSNSSNILLFIWFTSMFYKDPRELMSAYRRPYDEDIGPRPYARPYEA